VHSVCVNVMWAAVTLCVLCAQCLCYRDVGCCGTVCVVCTVFVLT